MSGDSEKNAWPEVLGIPVTPAVVRINSDRSDLAIEVLPIGADEVAGYDPGRIRVNFDARGLVALTPVVS